MEKKTKLGDAINSIEKERGKQGGLSFESESESKLKEVKNCRLQAMVSENEKIRVTRERGYQSESDFVRQAVLFFLDNFTKK